MAACIAQQQGLNLAQARLFRPRGNLEWLAGSVWSGIATLEVHQKTARLSRSGIFAELG